MLDVPETKELNETIDTNKRTLVRVKQLLVTLAHQLQEDSIKKDVSLNCVKICLYSVVIIQI
jgi:hypothetical protein